MRACTSDEITNSSRRLGQRARRRRRRRLPLRREARRARRRHTARMAAYRLHDRQRSIELLQRDLPSRPASVGLASGGRSASSILDAKIAAGTTRAKIATTKTSVNSSPRRRLFISQATRNPASALGAHEHRDARSRRRDRGQRPRRAGRRPEDPRQRRRVRPPTTASHGSASDGDHFDQMQHAPGNRQQQQTRVSRHGSASARPSPGRRWRCDMMPRMTRRMNTPSAGSSRPLATARPPMNPDDADGDERADRQRRDAAPARRGRARATSARACRACGRRTCCSSAAASAARRWRGGPAASP